MRSNDGPLSGQERQQINLVVEVIKRPRQRDHFHELRSGRAGGDGGRPSGLNLGRALKDQGDGEEHRARHDRENGITKQEARACEGVRGGI